MERKFVELAPKYFLEEGYSCSESILMAAVELGLATKEMVSVATSFSGGMGNGCLCGAVSGSMIVIGLLFGKFKTNTARSLASDFYKRFTSIHKVTCCKVLTKDFKDFHSKERKEHCVNMVYDCSKILDEILKENLEKVSV